MVTSPGAGALPAANPRAAGWSDRLARSGVHSRLARLREGCLVVDDFAGRSCFGAPRDPLRAALTVRDPAFYRRVALAGSTGFAESWLRGEWETADLAGVLRVFARNVARRDAGHWTHAAFARPFLRIAHRLRANTRRGSRRNIRAHYDLGNEFYALFLDETWSYSCAIFESPEATLAEASVAKMERVCRKLGLAPGMRVLEIGSGWGGFAIHAASRHGCRVTTTTISPAQRERAIERVRAAGVAQLVEVLPLDYRDLEGRFDRVVSIEMIEAVGYEHLGRYFRTCADRLAADGAMLLQAITIPDRFERAYRASADFIQREVFPGSALPSLRAIGEAVARHTDLGIAHVESIGRHYAETLRRWRAAFIARLPDVRALGFDERFIRLWRYYLCYCEAGFEERCIDDLQMLLVKPGWPGGSGRFRTPAHGSV